MYKDVFVYVAHTLSLSLPPSLSLNIYAVISHIRRM